MGNQFDTKPTSKLQESNKKRGSKWTTPLSHRCRLSAQEGSRRKGRRGMGRERGGAREAATELAGDRWWCQMMQNKGGRWDSRFKDASWKFVVLADRLLVFLFIYLFFPSQGTQTLDLISSSRFTYSAPLLPNETAVSRDIFRKRIFETFRVLGKLRCLKKT